MKIVCSYCKVDMGQKEPLKNPDLTHGICPKCEEYFVRQLDGLSLADYLDDYHDPILVVNEDFRVLAYNQAYSDKFYGEGKKQCGLLGGEFMECRYARMPGGCGNTVCCRDCILRRTITETMKTGEPQHEVKAYLHKMEDERPVRRKLTVSTEKKAGAVVVTLRNISPPIPV